MIRQDGMDTWVQHNIHHTDSNGDDNDDGGGDDDGDEMRTPS